MQRFSRALPMLLRWERPRLSVGSAAAVQPGGLAQGPEEKEGRCGRTSGFRFVMFVSPSREQHRVGAVWPAAGVAHPYEGASRGDSRDSRPGRRAFELAKIKLKLRSSL